MDTCSFCNWKCLNIVIIGFLIVLSIQLDPSRIPGPHTVRMITVDIDRSGKCPVDKRKNNRQSVGSCQKQFFPHQCQSCRGSCRHSSCASCFSSNSSRHGRVFAFDRNEFRINLTVRNIRRNHLRDFSGRCNRESRHNIRIHLANGICYSFVTGHSLPSVFTRAHGFTPSFISMAPKGQTLAQIPHPLQCS